VSTDIEFNVCRLKYGTFLPTIFPLSIKEVKKIIVINILANNDLRANEGRDTQALNCKPITNL
jgi:hypothetical protein